MNVTIGGQLCPIVEVTDEGLTTLRCTAPSGPGVGDVALSVTVAGSGTGSFGFQYDAPSVSWVLGSPCDAETACAVDTVGSNLGLENAATSPDPVVLIGKRRDRRGGCVVYCVCVV